MRTESDSSRMRAGASQASQPRAQVSHRRHVGGPWKAQRAWPHSCTNRTPGAHHPTMQAHLGAHRGPVILLLGLVLVCSSLACAPQFVGPTTAGYFFTLNIPALFIYPGDAAALIASVHNAQGQPVDDVPVTFQVEPAWAQSASVSPQVAYTRQGMARALFQARTTGVVRVTVRVDNATQETRIRVVSRPSPVNE
jgi:hypothetical protein